MKAYNKFLREQEKELKMLFSPFGKELQLNLVAQGYEDRLIYRFMILFGSGFTAVKLINNLKKEVKK